VGVVGRGALAKCSVICMYVLAFLGGRQDEASFRVMVVVPFSRIAMLIIKTCLVAADDAGCIGKKLICYTTEVKSSAGREILSWIAGTNASSDSHGITRLRTKGIRTARFRIRSRCVCLWGLARNPVTYDGNLRTRSQQSRWSRLQSIVQCA